MKIIIAKSFAKDTYRLPAKAKKKLKELIQDLAEAASIKDLPVTKLKGGKNAYRIRFGEYRIGIYWEKDSIILSRVLDRKDIYKYFPKK